MPSGNPGGDVDVDVVDVLSWPLDTLGQPCKTDDFVVIAGQPHVMLRRQIINFVA
jgi:hypothetical protein